MRTSRLGKAAAIPAALTLAACSATAPHTADSPPTPTLHKVHSQQVRIGPVYLWRSGSETQLRGVVNRRPPGRGPVYGHLVIELLDPGDQVLARVVTSPYRHNAKARAARFTARLPTVEAPVSVLRITHLGAAGQR